MNDAAGLTLAFTGHAWALLRDRGQLEPWETPAIVPDADGAHVRWDLLDANDRREVYWSIVRATARCHDRPDRLWFADVLHRLGNELIPEEGR